MVPLRLSKLHFLTAHDRRQSQTEKDVALESASSAALVKPSTSSGEHVVPKRSNASQVFGYDVFVSFALGPPPRGTHSYASDLVRRLRERDFAVFFSEDEAPPGSPLESTLRKALYRSKTLVVIANRATLSDPRWVRAEVEEFTKRHPERPVIPISIGGALEDQSLIHMVKEWLNVQDNIWLSESEEAIVKGIASEDLVNRLATAPLRARANIRWRWVVRTVVATLIALTFGAGFAAWHASKNATAAQNAAKAEREAKDEAVKQQGIAELQSAEAIRAAEAEREAKERAEARERANRQLLYVANMSLANIAFDQGDHARGHALLNSYLPKSNESNDQEWQNFFWYYLWFQNHHELRTLRGHRGAVSYIAFSPDAQKFATASWDHTIKLWDMKTLRPLATLKGHGNIVTSLAFSSDGNTLASG
jgi:TIR domain/WD domain, G-beta repeat